MISNTYAMAKYRFFKKYRIISQRKIKNGKMERYTITEQIVVDKNK